MAPTKKMLTGRRALLLATAISTFAAVDRAEACTVGGLPSTSASNSTVDCSDDTTNTAPGGKSGYGTLNDNNNTYNVHAGVTVTGQNFGFITGDGGTFNNSGAVKSGSDGILAGDDVTINNFSTGTIGTISGVHGISVGTLTLHNDGTITGTRSAIDLGGSSATINNAKTISGTGASGAGITVLATDTIINADGNTGTITGVAFGIEASDGNITVSNGSGTISATGISATGAYGIGIEGLHDVTVSANPGTISGSLIGIQAATVNVKGNAGTISGGSFGINATDANASSSITNSNLITGGDAGIFAAGTVTVANLAGTIEGTRTTVLGDGINAATVNLVNATAAKVTGARNGITATTANIDNAGAISGVVAAISAKTATIANAGSIFATADDGTAAIVADTANVTNMRGGTISGGSLTSPFLTSGISAGVANVTNMRGGAISGAIAIVATGAGGVGSKIVNAGDIVSTFGATGTAIQLSAAADTLTLLSGSHVVGVVDMGGGNDIVNVSVTAPSSKVSSITTAADLPTFVHFTGKTNITFSGGGFVGPTAQSGTQLATLDPTALAQADRTLMDFTSGVSSLVQGRLNGVSPSSNGAMTAMSYAPENSNAGPFTKAPGRDSAWINPAPITVWASSFGGQRTQDATASTLRATSTAFGGAIGIDRKVRPDWLVGAFIGGGQGGLSVDLSSQKVDTDYVFAGAYSRFEWASHFFDVTFQGGNAANKSDRLVLNDLAAGGTERAKASYNGWFISPEVAYGFRQDIGNGYVLTPTARVRYVAGMFDGFNETGSAQGLRIGSRTLQDFEERGELDVSRVTTFFGADHSLKTNLHGGVIALQRAGDGTVNAVLIGQNLAFTTPGKGSTVGWVAGAGIDYHVNPNVALFGAVEGAGMSDQSRTVSAKGGVRAAF